MNAVADPNSKTTDTIRYQEVQRLLKETTQHGFRFTIDMEPNALVQDWILKCDQSKEFLQSPAWKDLGVITQMMATHTADDYPALYPLFERLQARIIHDNIRSLAPNFIKENGPFFVANDQKHIRVACFSGNLLYDATLLILLSNHIIPYGTIAQCA